MQTTWKVTEADRDVAGSIKVDSIPLSEPRSLEDLLPKSAAIRADYRRITPHKMSRQEIAALAVVALLAAFVIVYAWATPRAPAAAPAARPTTVATVQPTSAPTLAPTAEMAALVAFFDYSDPSTVASITTNQITRVIGQAGAWRLVDTGDARVWLRADQVPTGIPADAPLPDLTPRQRAPIAPAPAVQPVVAPVATPAPCTRDIAQYVVSRQVLFGTLPIGSAMGFSCTSAAEAEANVSAHEAAVRASYQATTTTKTSEATP